MMLPKEETFMVQAARIPFSLARMPPSPTSRVNLRKRRQRKDWIVYRTHNYKSLINGVNSTYLRKNIRL